MTTKLLLCAGLAAGLALQVCPTALAQSTYTIGSGTLNEIIPDNNLNGLASTINVNVPMNEITDVQINLDITGVPNGNDAYNGDFYAYVQFASGLEVLLNHIDTPPQFGSPGSGMSITLSDSGTPNVANAPYASGQPLTGTYAPQGPGTLDGTFGGLAPGGAWTLFIADESPGGVGQLQDWSVVVTGVPDNGSTILLLGMGIGGMGLCSLRQSRSRRLS